MSLSRKSQSSNLFMIGMGVALIGLVATVYATLNIQTPNSEAASKNGTVTITLNQTTPKLGDSINFTVKNAPTNARIQVACYQGGVTGLVWSADGSTSTTFVLGGSTSQWQTVGGSAQCYAWLYQGSVATGILATTSFAAQGK